MFRAPEMTARRWEGSPSDPLAKERSAQFRSVLS
jgi:hypothetical protein